MVNPNWLMVLKRIIINTIIFGIGAFDQDAIATGHSYAKEHNWTTPSKAIMGGAAFIRHQYFENEQITLYQMRWNPKNPGSHQYASDIEWADKIADNMKKIMNVWV